VTVAARAEAFARDLQERICRALETEEAAAAAEGGGAAVAFTRDEWRHHEGGGGLTRVLRGGAVFEQAGVNFSAVAGTLAPELTAALPGDGATFTAAGVSLVIHPASPRVPAVHMNVRCLERGAALWFGGGADLTPYVPVREDVLHFHRVLKEACDRHGPALYGDFKRQCDEYFYLPHRGETRGVGGIFFDYLRRDPEGDLALWRDVGDAFLPAYLPLVQRRRREPWDEAARQLQLLRRGRYVEFNLLYDRGTRFGLQTGGRPESILMSLPPLVRWEYGPPGPAEAALREWLRPWDWLAGEGPG
jgi:coproporphyrinogen III oxidase